MLSAQKSFVTLFITDPKQRILRHLLLFIGLLLVFSTGEDVYVSPVNTYASVGTFIFMFIVLYINIYVLVPWLLFKGRFNSYFFGLVVLVLLCFALVIFADQWLQPYKIDQSIKSQGLLDGLIGFSFILLIFFGASTAIKLFQQRIADQERISELGKMSMQAELEQLKNQINPHFLFNMLNNANVLVHVDPDKASQVLHKLSDLLRYQLYDCMQNTILLTGEIHFLTDFLNLEKIRRDNFNFLVSKEGDISGVQVPPFLFITFVENAVKHNLDAKEPSYVDLFFSVVENELQFMCINSKPKVPPRTKNKGGLGLVNVQRRLQLLYKDKHELSFSQDEEKYSVTLKIKI